MNKALLQQARGVLRGCLEHPGAADAIAALESAIAQSVQPVQPDSDPCGWIINYTLTGSGREVFCRHNSVGDYRRLDADATATPVFTALAQPVQPDLKALVQKVHKAKGRHHNQIAMCDLYDACGLNSVRPGQHPVQPKETK